MFSINFLAIYPPKLSCLFSFNICHVSPSTVSCLFPGNISLIFPDISCFLSLNICQAFPPMFSFLPLSWQCSLVSLSALFSPMLLWLCLRSRHSHHIDPSSSSPPLSLPFHSSLFTNIFYFSWRVQTQPEFSLTFTKHLGLVRFYLSFAFLINNQF